MASPTQRTLAWLREMEVPCQVVEKWNPHAKIRQDLFGFIDILAIFDDMTVGIQTTSGSGHSARLKKIMDSDLLRPWLNGPARKVWIVSWSKKCKVKDGKKQKVKVWQVRVEEVSL